MCISEDQLFKLNFSRRFRFSRLESDSVLNFREKQPKSFLKHHFCPFSPGPEGRGGGAIYFLFGKNLRIYVFPTIGYREGTLNNFEVYFTHFQKSTFAHYNGMSIILLLGCQYSYRIYVANDTPHLTTFFW